MTPHSTPDGKTPNRLALEKSPYLLQHQWNPVDWRPFGDEAIAAARSADKALFLSIGYSTCHWCHVMEKESFENEAVARVMNDLFVNVKIDREERPDLDQIYMQATIAMHGQGGWPLSVWVTPELKPFYCGTYFPPVSRYGRPGFVDVLKSLADLYRDRRADALAQADEVVKWLVRPAPASIPGDDAIDLMPAAAARALVGSFDDQWGGFGGAPKFPRPAVLDLLSHLEAREPAEARRRAIGHTLEMMWRGGIYDHVGGGFCRYATDERWLIPHFEKMLYDNAQLIEAYLDGAASCERPDFIHVAEDVAAFVAREMTGPEGGFHSAQDADSEGEEGLFYKWTLAELDLALGADAARFARIMGATAAGNFEGANILHWPASPAETAKAEGMSPDSLRAFVASARSRLYRAREERVRPSQDDKVLASWNGLMIHALARLGATTANRGIVERAVRAAVFVETRLETKDGRLRRRWRDGEARFDASLDDYACVAFGFVGLFEATGDPAWIARAKACVLMARRLFEDERGGFFFAAETPDLVVRMKEIHDGAIPSGNALIALVCARLSAITHDEALRALGQRTVRAIAADIATFPHAAPLLFSAWVELNEPPRSVHVAARRSGADFDALLARAHRAVHPGRVVVPLLFEHRERLAELGITGDAAPAFPETPTALLCENETCRPFPSG
jgi:uncharacterized protein